MKKIIITILVVIVIVVAGGLIYIHQLSAPLTLSKNTALPFSAPSELGEILYYGSLAPNAHNAQMWRVVFNPNGMQLDIYLDASRKLPHTDPDNREAYISLGAFVKSLTLTAGAFDYETEVVFYADPTDQLVATIRIWEPSKATAPDSELLTLFEKRHTDKRAYKADKLPPETVSKLLEAYPGSLYYYPKGSPEYAYLAQNAVAAMEVQSYNAEKLRELALWMRFSNKEAAAKADGLPAEQLGITGFTKGFYYALYNRNKAGSEAFAAQAVKQTANQVANCAGFFVIIGNDNTQGWFEAGMVLAEFWLKAADQNIAMHPLSQILEEMPYKDNIQRDLDLPQQPQMILRAGLVDDYGYNHKIRRSPADFTLLQSGE